ncbi:hypothetical protein BV22DRAFT_1011926, partial [Leucogyrophana mollusca]
SQVGKEPPVAGSIASLRAWCRCMAYHQAARLAPTIATPPKTGRPLGTGGGAVFLFMMSDRTIQYMHAF